MTSHTRLKLIVIPSVIASNVLALVPTTSHFCPIWPGKERSPSQPENPKINYLSMQKIRTGSPHCTWQLALDTSQQQFYYCEQGLFHLLMPEVKLHCTLPVQMATCLLLMQLLPGFRRVLIIRITEE